MSTVLALPMAACVAVVVLLLVYFITRSNYSARAAAAEATVTQLTVQLGARESELNALRGQLATEQSLRVCAQATLDGERQSIIDQKNTLNEAEQKLTTVFEGLASKALANNTTAFLQLADATLKSGAVKELESLVKPIEETLGTYQANLKAIEDARLTAYGQITTTLSQVSQTQETLKNETQNLVSSLRRPNVRGRWGELTLRRVAELTGMSEHCDFDLQAQIETEDGNSLRPDMTIRTPEGSCCAGRLQSTSRPIPRRHGGHIRGSSQGTPEETC